ncbi:50S ribosomal protein L7ae [Thermosipho melanesiensis]|uniref:Ribosomal protein L7Ae/L30e/S12e/Gadd45 n=2 Tax=Thermosipho melanesiensis TaxID=46541 RepID=A6LKE6_THEM4|nr:ribosomal L7Ae/L30e/S12e/Gadd45 family protein [Thermosipho melanesiensis]ABR30397.1 ribosomal protein L7Ae/L30e/S12e/Gadd45 [Thermosipho melanesiensis BI429]APT73559.1 50S ribosomal protein L7 [Thermosipho melanesiensis]OOC37510.1 50S ribosomal protein L7ae [Thermosipho melanesiensis]OOC39549.1 50S ribosomal protein L7ae [Thermosipho melanesiensis]OOC39566.1 50S ribosomal protein L7ae [Thermosipho melanesiensis]
MNEQKILTLLGFASKAKKLVYGKDNIRDYIKNTKLRNKIIVMAKDTGERVKKDVKIRCEISNVPYIEIATKEILSKATGMFNISVLGVLDESMVKSILAFSKEGGNNENINS